MGDDRWDKCQLCFEDSMDEYDEFVIEEENCDTAIESMGSAFNLCTNRGLCNKKCHAETVSH